MKNCEQNYILDSKYGIKNSKYGIKIHILSGNRANYKLFRLEIFTSAFRETGVSRYDGGPIKDFPWTPQYHSAVIFDVLMGAPSYASMMLRNASLSNRCSLIMVVSPVCQSIYLFAKLFDLSKVGEMSCKLNNFPVFNFRQLFLAANIFRQMMSFKFHFTFFFAMG